MSIVLMNNSQSNIFLNILQLSLVDPTVYIWSSIINQMAGQNFICVLYN